MKHDFYRSELLRTRDVPMPWYCLAALRIAGLCAAFYLGMKVYDWIH
jgi:hypothetical protein